MRVVYIWELRGAGLARSLEGAGLREAEASSFAAGRASPAKPPISHPIPVGITRIVGVVLITLLTTLLKVLV